MENKDEIPIRMYDSKGEESIEIVLTFDQVYRDWMQKLLCFVKKVAIERDEYMDVMFCKPEYSFFGTAESVADQFFYFLMKDELSGSNGNSALDILCQYVTTREGRINAMEYAINRGYMIKLCTKEFNAMLIGQIYDFYISMWSCFEAAINSLCMPFEEMIKKKLEDSNFVKITKYIKSCLKDIDNETDIIDLFERNKERFIKKFPQYVSFPAKIDFLFGDIFESYSRDIKKDKEVLSFCGRLRNTIHNNGINQGGEQELEINGHIFRLEKRERVYYESYQDIMILVNEIFDIYTEIIRTYNRDFQGKE